MKETRINKYLSEIGYCSRRAADKLIAEKRVTINGEIPELGTKITENDTVEVNGEVVGLTKNKKVYIAYNKPRGIECTTDTRVNKNIISHINYPTRIFPIGRLDKDSQGLILLTNDGDIVNKLLRSRYEHEKEYEVVVDKDISDHFLEKMSNGLPILDTITKKCEIEKINDRQFKIILTQGLNRQIRRMCEYLGYEVKKLVRTRFINIHLDMKIGKYRDVSQDELSILLSK